MVAVLNIEPRKRMQQPGRVRGSMRCEGKTPTEQISYCRKLLIAARFALATQPITESQSVANTLHLTSRGGRMIVQDRCSNRVNSCA